MGGQMNQMRSLKNIKCQQKRIEKQRLKSKAKKKLKNIKKQKAKDIIFQLLRTINHFFPYLFDRIRQIKDYRKKSDYELVELITASIAMYLFKEGSRNAFNNDRQEGKFKKKLPKDFQNAVASYGYSRRCNALPGIW